MNRRTRLATLGLAGALAVAGLATLAISDSLSSVPANRSVTPVGFNINGVNLHI